MKYYTVMSRIIILEYSYMNLLNLENSAPFRNQLVTAVIYATLPDTCLSVVKCDLFTTFWWIAPYSLIELIGPNVRTPFILANFETGFVLYQFRSKNCWKTTHHWGPNRTFSTLKFWSGRSQTNCRLCKRTCARVVISAGRRALLGSSRSSCDCSLGAALIKTLFCLWFPFNYNTRTDECGTFQSKKALFIKAAPSLRIHTPLAFPYGGWCVDEGSFPP